MREWCIDRWEWCSEFFRSKPITVIILFFVSIALTAAITYSTVSTTANTSNINDVKRQFCNAPDGTEVDEKMNRRRCRQLLDQLLKNPTPRQRERIQDIAGSRP